MSTRSLILAGNWKLHKTIEETKAFIADFSPRVDPSSRRILIAPPFTAIAAAAASAASKGIAIGSQNSAEHDHGAYTGEVSAAMVKEAGGSFTILGHSERRILFGETDQIIERKLRAAVEAGLESILCIGETLEQQQHGETEMILKRQIAAAAQAADPKKLMIAYEPVWAIGTGKTATPEYAQTMHAFIRNELEKHFGKDADTMPILYGGSAKADNALALLSHPDIDGLLVGGASLQAESFLQIVTESEKTLL